jgi:predicted membrane channel-forming protein YqfA (hemolysin III family)
MSGQSSRNRSDWLRFGFSIFSATILSVYLLSVKWHV